MNLGILLGTSPQHLILRCHEWEEGKAMPNIDEQVFDTDKKLIGRIADIFGPVKKPFISVKLSKTSTLTLDDFNEKKGQSFYTIPDMKKKFRNSSGNSPRAGPTKKPTNKTSKPFPTNQPPNKTPRTSPDRKSSK
jgi:rRNA processing protein Gar1